MKTNGCEVHVGDHDRWAIYMPCRKPAAADVISRTLIDRGYVACRDHASEAQDNGHRVDWHADEEAKA